MQPHEVAVPIVLFSAIAAVFFVWVTSRHRERMSMIEKGLSSDEIKAMYSRDVKRDPLNSLKWGLLFLLTGVAVMTGNFLHNQYGMEEGPAMISTICLFVGIGLVLFYSIASKKVGS
jgi:Na+/melibiose symporter-like transporter